MHRVSRVSVIGSWHVVALLALVMLCHGGTTPTATGKFGAFDASTDVGTVERPGSVEFNAATGEYRVTGGGENMWKETDAFHFVHRQLSGDVALTAKVALLGEGGNAHRKAGLIVRQSLEADAPYVDVMAHGEGLIALQYRDAKGAVTKDIKSTVKAPATLKLERHGDEFTAAAAPAAGGDFQPIGSVKVSLKDPVYVGLAVCAHDPKASTSASFSEVTIKQADEPHGK
jgi:hypothetical protein